MRFVGAKRPLDDTLGPAWDELWTDFWPTWGPILTIFEINFGHSWHNFETNLAMLACFQTSSGVNALVDKGLVGCREAQRILF